MQLLVRSNTPLIIEEKQKTETERTFAAFVTYYLLITCYLSNGRFADPRNTSIEFRRSHSAAIAYDSKSVNSDLKIVDSVDYSCSFTRLNKREPI